MIYLITIVLSLLCTSQSLAVCGGSSPNWISADCTQAEVVDCIDKALTGDTITIASGECSWTEGVGVFADGCKSLTVQGSGTLGTVITNNITTLAEGYIGSTFFTRGTCASNNVTLLNLHLKQGSTSPANGMIYISGTLNRAVIGTSKFEGSTTLRGVYVGSEVDAVIFSNTFSQMGLIVQFSGDTQWAAGPKYNTDDGIVYVEGNTFSATSELDLDCDTGGRIAYRYNSISGSAPSNHGRDSVIRGCVQMDIYNNSIVQQGSYDFCGIQFRGGTGVVYNNILTGTFTHNVFLQSYCSDNETEEVCTYGLGEPGYRCGELDYPCPDQVGYGKGDWNGTQTSYPIYEWNNCKTALGCESGINNIDPTVEDINWVTTHIQSGREFFINTENESYVEYTCPHPLTGLTGSCNSAVAGTAGYNVNLGLKGSFGGSGALNTR